MCCPGRRWFLLGNNADWRATFCHPPIALWDLFFDQVFILISSATHLYGILPWKTDLNGARFHERGFVKFSLQNISQKLNHVFPFQNIMILLIFVAAKAGIAG